MSKVRDGAIEDLIEDLSPSSVVFHGTVHGI